jgi:hypothetical protein
MRLVRYGEWKGIGIGIVLHDGIVVTISSGTSIDLASAAGTTTVRSTSWRQTTTILHVSQHSYRPILSLSSSFYSVPHLLFLHHPLSSRHHQR